MLHGSPWLDTAWYRERYPDVGSSGGDPARHYLERGEPRGCCPSPWFDPVDYRRMYPDVAAAGVSPLLHFLQHGCAEGRLPRRLQAEELEGRLWSGSGVAVEDPLDIQRILPDDRLERVLADTNKGADYLREIAVMLETAQDFERAFRVIEKAERLRPKAKDIRRTRERIERKRGLLDEVEEEQPRAARSV